VAPLELVAYQAPQALEQFQVVKEGLGELGRLQHPPTGPIVAPSPVEVGSVVPLVGVSASMLASAFAFRGCDGLLLLLDRKLGIGRLYIDGSG
jgi:hypothetical protein